MTRTISRRGERLTPARQSRQHLTARSESEPTAIVVAIMIVTTRTLSLPGADCAVICRSPSAMVFLSNETEMSGLWYAVLGAMDGGCRHRCYRPWIRMGGSAWNPRVPCRECDVFSSAWPGCHAVRFGRTRSDSSGLPSRDGTSLSGWTSCRATAWRSFWRTAPMTRGIASRRGEVLASAGHGVFLFDFPGHGESGGEVHRIRRRRQQWKRGGLSLVTARR